MNSVKIRFLLQIFLLLLILFNFVVGCSEDSEDTLLVPEVVSIFPPVSVEIPANILFTIHWNEEVKPNSGIITLGGKTGKLVSPKNSSATKEMQWKTDTPFDRPEDGPAELTISEFLSRQGILQKEDFKVNYIIRTPCKGAEPVVISVIPNLFSIAIDHYIDAIKILGQNIHPDHLENGIILEIDEPVIVEDFSVVERGTKETPIHLEFLPKEGEFLRTIKISSFKLQFNKRYIIKFIIADRVGNMMSVQINFTTISK